MKLFKARKPDVVARNRKMPNDVLEKHTSDNLQPVHIGHVNLNVSAFSMKNRKLTENFPNALQCEALEVKEVLLIFQY
jgi:hypothetical protein